MRRMQCKRQPAASDRNNCAGALVNYIVVTAAAVGVDFLLLLLSASFPSFGRYTVCARRPIP